MTYPEPAVEAAISQVVPLQMNVKEEATKPVIERIRHVWTPDIRLIGPDSFDYGGWNGYLPPFEYIPQLLVTRAMATLRQHQFEAAATLYEDVLKRYPTSFAAPEALYFLGVARYEASGEGGDLTRPWHQLQSRYPASNWRIRQSFVEK